MLSSRHPRHFWRRDPCWPATQSFRVFLTMLGWFWRTSFISLGLDGSSWRCWCSLALQTGRQVWNPPENWLLCLWMWRSTATGLREMLRGLKDKPGLATQCRTFSADKHGQIWNNYEQLNLNISELNGKRINFGGLRANGWILPFTGLILPRARMQTGYGSCAGAALDLRSVVLHGADLCRSKSSWKILEGFLFYAGWGFQEV